MWTFLPDEFSQIVSVCRRPQMERASHTSGPLPRKSSKLSDWLLSEFQEFPKVFFSWLSHPHSGSQGGWWTLPALHKSSNQVDKAIMSRFTRLTDFEVTKNVACQKLHSILRRVHPVCLWSSLLQKGMKCQNIQNRLRSSSDALLVKLISVSLYSAWMQHVTKCVAHPKGINVRASWGRPAA